jgi:hypothetical protein
MFVVAMMLTGWGSRMAELPIMTPAAMSLSTNPYQCHGKRVLVSETMYPVVAIHDPQKSQLLRLSKESPLHSWGTAVK